MNKKVVNETSKTCHRHGVFDQLDKDKLGQ
jgi:hypothetical protein